MLFLKYAKSCAASASICETSESEVATKSFAITTQDALATSLAAEASCSTLLSTLEILSDNMLLMKLPSRQ